MRYLPLDIPPAPWYAGWAQSAHTKGGPMRQFDEREDGFDHDPLATGWELYQMRRAEAAKRYFGSPEYAAILAQDRRRQIHADIAAGHSPKCGILNCHPECPRLK